MINRTVGDAAVAGGFGTGGFSFWGNVLKTSLGTSQNTTPTAAQLVGGYCTQTSATGAGTITLPTGTQMSAAFAGQGGAQIGDSFDCLFANLGGGFALTVTGASGTTVIGGAAIASAKAGLIRFVCTAANAWDVFVLAGA